jgi:copper transport protein
MKHLRRALAVLVVMAVCALGSLLHARPAEAHASLVASSPAELEILSTPPQQLMLVFDEAVEPDLSAVLVTGPRRTSLRVGTLTHGRFAPSYLVAELSGPAPAGDWTVTWRAVSNDDGHATGGSFSFRTLTAGTARAALDNTSPSPRLTGGGGVRAVYGTARWSAFLGFSVLAGGAYFLVICRLEARTRRAALLVVAGGGVLLVSTGAALVTYGPQAERSSAIWDLSLLRATLASRVGHLLLLRLALLVGLAGVALVVARARQRAGALPQGSREVVLGAAAALAATWSLASHSDSGGHPLPLVALDVMHLVACAIWLGGLAVLGLVVLVDKDSASSRQAARRFSSTAATCVGVLVFTGSVQAWQRVGTPHALLDNEYALLLLGKLGLVWLTLLLAGVARFRVLRVPVFNVSALRRVVYAEAALAVAVLTVTSVLVTTQPARSAHAELVAARTASRPEQAALRPAALAVQPLSGQAPYDAGRGESSRGVVAVTVVAPRVGVSEVHLTVLDAAGDARAVDQLVAALKPPTGPQVPLTLRLIEPGHYVSTGARFTVAGAWRLGLALRLPSGAGALVTVGVQVT